MIDSFKLSLINSSKLMEFWDRVLSIIVTISSFQKESEKSSNIIDADVVSTRSLKDWKNHLTWNLKRTKTDLELMINGNKENKRE